MVRQRNRLGQGPGKAKRSLCRKDSSGSMSEIPTGKDEGLYRTQTLLKQNNHLCWALKIFSGILLLSLPLLCFVAGWTEALPDTPVEEAPPGPEVPEKIKKRYRKKKTKLEEAFPTYLQVDFNCNLQLDTFMLLVFFSVFFFYLNLSAVNFLTNLKKKKLNKIFFLNYLTQTSNHTYQPKLHK